jgi:hypothetical protein
LYETGFRFFFSSSLLIVQIIPIFFAATLSGWGVGVDVALYRAPPPPGALAALAIFWFWIG